MSFLPALIVIGVILLVIGGAVMLSAMDAQQRAELLREAQPATLAEAAANQVGPGAVKLEALLQAEQPARMPTDVEGETQPVIHGFLQLTARITEWDQERNRERTRTRSVFTQTYIAEQPFLEEGGTRLALDPRALRDSDVRGRDVPARAYVRGGYIYYGDISARVPGGYRTRGSSTARVTKRVIEEGERVLVVGALEERGGEAVLTAPPGGKLQLYTDSEEEVLAALESRASWQVPAGGALMGFGVLLAAIGGIAFAVKGRGDD